jgi:protein-disulfide isomerase
VQRNTILAGVAAVTVLALGVAAWQFGPWGADTAAPTETATVSDEATPAIGTLADASGQPMTVYEDDHILGSPDAPITMIEYASLTCPHCADFHNNVLPEIKKNYIDEGLVRLVYRDFPLDKVALRGSLIADCAPDENYFRILGVIFNSQEQWATTADPVAALDQIGRMGGLSAEAIETCTNDDALIQKILGRAQEAQNLYGINSTPSFVINGQVVKGTLSYEEYDQILKDMLPKS